MKTIDNFYIRWGSSREFMYFIQFMNGHCKAAWNGDGGRDCFYGLVNGKPECSMKIDRFENCREILIEDWEEELKEKPSPLYEIY